MTNLNVYACLVCGKYLHGRGIGTPAYTHSMENDHHIFLNLIDQKVFCLPDNYEVIDSSLGDIKRNLDPVFTLQDIDSIPDSSISLTGTVFVPGLTGLNPIRENSYMNAAIHALVPLAPIRDIFLIKSGHTSKLSSSFSELVRKMYNPDNFKGLVSPHAFMQIVGQESNKRFFSSYNDPIQFIDWLLSNLGSDLSSYFQGTIDDNPFWYLDLDLPPITVFRDETESIPTIPLMDLLDKRLCSSTLTLPPYLIIKINRFVANDFFTEKNSTIVRYPLRGLDLSDLVQDDGIHQYDLVSVICHEGPKPDAGHFKTFAVARNGDWFECNGIRVSKVLPQSVAVVESYITIWKKK